MHQLSCWRDKRNLIKSIAQEAEDAAKKEWSKNTTYDHKET